MLRFSNIINTPNCICQLKPCTISFNLFRYVPENNGRGISPNDPLFLGTYLSTFKYYIEWYSVCTYICYSLATRVIFRVRSLFIGGWQGFTLSKNGRAFYIIGWKMQKYLFSYAPNKCSPSKSSAPFPWLIYEPCLLNYCVSIAFESHKWCIYS